jgi:DNA mismatch repair ATPase MutS
MKQQCYPILDTDHVKNNCNLENNYIITGPNASGKTTILKSATINVIFTQQFGVGYYESFTIKPYTHIHSYLNIPDTSGRDSLFQAESRRCKEIIDIIDASDENASRHFCIFDELFSGTNPTEATQAARAF